MKVSEEVVIDTLEFRQSLPCHPKHSLVMTAPYRTTRDGRRDYESRETSLVCPDCGREYLMRNLKTQAITRRRDDSKTVAECFADITKTLGGE